MISEEIINNFIFAFRDARSVFMNGCCYWFSFILKERFDGYIMYEPIENHFVTLINGNYYDARGCVTVQYIDHELIDWRKYEQIDNSHYQRIVRDCIDKAG